MAGKNKFPSEMIDIPSGGKLYPENHPLAGGKVEVKFMTAREEDILTSQNLIRKGVVVDRLLDSLILTPGVTAADLFIGDKNAIMVAARILAYGSDYTIDIENPDTGDLVKKTFNLADLPYKLIPDYIDYSGNRFKFTLPASKIELEFRLLTGRDELDIDKTLKSLSKLDPEVSPEITVRLKRAVVSVDGEEKASAISEFVDNMLSRDSRALRNEMERIAPDIEMSQEIEIGGKTVEVAVPMTVEFFWPSS